MLYVVIGCAPLPDLSLLESIRFHVSVCVCWRRPVLF